MIRKNQSISHNNILPSPCRKHHNLSDIIRSQGLTPFINFISSSFIAVESHNRELGFHLSGVDLYNADPSGDEFATEGVGEGADGSFGRAVDASAGVGLAAGDAADVYDIAGAGVASGLENGEDGLGHGY